jgi:hypothetical protein
MSPHQTPYQKGRRIAARAFAPRAFTAACGARTVTPVALGNFAREVKAGAASAADRTCASIAQLAVIQKQDERLRT